MTQENSDQEEERLRGACRIAVVSRLFAEEHARHIVGYLRAEHTEQYGEGAVEADMAYVQEVVQRDYSCSPHEEGDERVLEIVDELIERALGF